MDLYPHQQKFIDDIKDCFLYKEGRLFWKKKLNARAPVGKEAGYKEPRGYINVSFRGKKHKLHRLIWIYHNGFIPDGLVIDHINQNKKDNRIENLRAVSVSRNSHNSDKADGVRKHSSVDRWQAYITIDGEYYHLGNHKTKKQALNARKHAKERLQH